MRVKKAVKGDMFIVDNQERKFGGDPQYIFVWATLASGTEPTALLFTEEEVFDAILRAKKNEEDIPELGSDSPVNEFDPE